MRRESALTILELMVVVAIVAILAALGMRYAWKDDRGRGFARSAQMAVFNARSRAVAIGIQRYTTGPTPEPNTPRAACMPNTRLRIARDSIEQHECTLNQSVTANTYPCISGVVDDCTWSGAVRTYRAPRGFEITRIHSRAIGGSWANVSGFPAAPVDLYFRPNGSSDTALGTTNEEVQLLIKNLNVADATCQAEHGLCFMVLSESSKIATVWGALAP